MIQLVESKTPYIRFTKRKGFKGSVKPLELELVYGHRCPVCGNVMQALFKTEAPVSLWPYEETAVLSQGTKNAGELLKTLPNEKSEYGDSCYESDFQLAGGVGSQKIRLKNHIMRSRALADRQFTGEGLFEVGERCCMKTGIFSIRQDLLVKDFCLFSMMQGVKIPLYNLPNIDQIITGTDDKIGRLVNAVGNAPPVILVERTSLIHGFNFYLEPRLEPYLKKKAITK